MKSVQKYLIASAIAFLSVWNIAQAQPDYIFWSDAEDGAIYRGTIGNPEFEEIFVAQLPIAMDAASNGVYWYDVAQSAIRYTQLGNGNSTVILPELRQVQEIVVSRNLDSIFWLDDTAIHKAKIDGTVTEVLISGLTNTADLALDETEKKLYWIEEDDVYRADIDGTNREEILSDLDGVYELAISNDPGFIYWININDDLILRSQLDGTNIETVVSSTPVSSLALDNERDLLYWGESETIYKAQLDGSSITELATNQLPLIEKLAVDVDTGNVFWIDGSSRDRSRIQYSDLQSVNALVEGYSQPAGVSVDTLSNNLYWIGENGEVMTASFEGSDPKVVREFQCGIGMLSDIAIDHLSEQIYWGYNGDCAFSLLRADLNAGEVDNFLSGSQTRPLSIALDPFGERVYWTDFQQYRGLFRANYDGTGLERFLEVDATGIAIDLVNSKLYWSDSNVGTITRADLDGNGAEIILDGLSQPTDLALDVRGGHIYWIEREGGMIRRSNLIGEEIEDLFTGLASPSYLGLSFENSIRVSNEGYENQPDKQVKLSTYPNPFRFQTSIVYETPIPAHVHLSIYDVLGREVAILEDRWKAAGQHEISFKADTDLPAGVYLVRFIARDRISTNRIILVR